MPYSPCRAWQRCDRSLGAVKAQRASAALAVIVEPQRVTPRALEAFQLPCCSAGAHIASGAYLTVDLTLFVLVFALLAVCAAFALWCRGMCARSARLHLVLVLVLGSGLVLGLAWGWGWVCGFAWLHLGAAFWAFCSTQTNVTFIGARQQRPRPHPPCWAVQRRGAAHGAEGAILARQGDEGPCTAGVPGRAPP